MKNAFLNISVLKFATHAVVGSSGEVKLYPSVAFELLAVLQIGMNFRPRLKASNHWGFYDNEKSKWRGMIGQLVDNAAELALSGSVDLPQRRTVIDFNLPLFEWKLLALYRTPDLDHGKLA